MIAQLGVQEKVHKLYVNKTQPGQTSASVIVEESGEYLVSILPIIKGSGITNSSVEYREVVMLEDTLPGKIMAIANSCHNGFIIRTADTDANSAGRFDCAHQSHAWSELLYTMCLCSRGRHDKA